jgi:hypothetical protein
MTNQATQAHAPDRRRGPQSQSAPALMVKSPALMVKDPMWKSTSPAKLADADLTNLIFFFLSSLTSSPEVLTA